MYELEIRNSENEVMKTYSADKIYISDVFIEENMMTLNRVVKSGETYTVTSQDYISSNEEKKTKSITLEAFSTDLKEKQMRLTYEKEFPILFLKSCVRSRWWGKSRSRSR